MYRLERRIGGHVGRDRLGQLLVADQRHLDAVPVHVGRDPVRFGRVLDLRHETPVDQPFVVLVEEAHGALESRFGGHDVPHVPAMHFGDGQHHGVERRDVAAHDGLQGEDHRGERSMGPVPFCGYPAWVPWACSVTLNFTQPAIIGCGPMAICPGA